MLMFLNCNRLICVLASFCLSVPAAAAADSLIRIGGSGMGLATLRILVTEYSLNHPGITAKVFPSMGSSGSIKGIQAGALDIGISSRTLTISEQGTLLAHPYAKTPFVIAAAPGTPLDSLSLNQLAKLYLGSPRTWADGTPVRLILRPTTDSDHAALQSISPEIAQALNHAQQRVGLLVPDTDQEAASALEKLPGAIGSTTLALVLSEKRKVKLIALDNVKPSLENLANGSYPYHKKMFLILRRNASLDIRSFVEFIFSPAGKLILEANGQLPVRE